VTRFPKGAVQSAGESARGLEDERDNEQRQDKARFGEGVTEGTRRVILEHNRIVIRVQRGGFLYNVATFSSKLRQSKVK
jgi:hypothetical protein